MSLGVFLGNARENVGVIVKTAGPETVLANNCIQASSQSELSVNNVRTIMRGAGDFWWDGTNAKYEVPQNSGKHSLFAGSLWIGGLSDDNTLKVAAMTYRQTGVDFWPGPLDGEKEILDPNTGLMIPNANYGQTDQEVCSKYNKHWKVRLDEVLSFYQNEVLEGDSDPEYSRPTIIDTWPGNGVDGELDEMLAPFYDWDGDGIYDPNAKDFPAYDILEDRDCKTDDLLFGDETIFFVFNDRGNVHSETNSSETIGLEIRAQAFGFTTNDEINDMTFYNFKIINRSIETLNQTYIGHFVDSDIGKYDDDYVGCDVRRGLGYSYNGDEFDDGALGYGANPPAIGMDFFRGPKADNGDGIDNDFDGCIDCTFDEDGNPIADTDLPELISMSKFVYYNNNRDPKVGNPDDAPHYYNYLIGRWKDNTPMTWGGNGTDPNSDPTNWMFPGDTDPNHPGESWTEEGENNSPDDRRFLISAGPFTLEPGAVNLVTTGLVWAKATEGGAFASVQKMRIADDKAQALFDNCFAVLNGPDAPDVSLQRFDKEFILTLTNGQSSNNFNEAYEEVDPTLISTEDLDITNNSYKFEGYQIFQLVDETVSPSDLYDSDKAKLLFQVDVKNYRLGPDSTTNFEDPIDELINHEYDLNLGQDIPKNKTIVATNSGIKHSFRITEDLFALGDKKLVNHKYYYYMAVAYGYNEYMVYMKDVNFDGNILNPSMLGQKLPFKAGRRNIKVASGFPFKNSNEFVGEYGARPAMTRLQGQGNSGFEIQMTQNSMDSIKKNFCVADVDYLENFSPVDIFVLDPEKVKSADFIFEFIPESQFDEEIDDETTWRLIRTIGEASDTVLSSSTISILNEQLIPKWGLAVNANVIGDRPWDSKNTSNGFISATINFEDESNEWLEFMQDMDYEDNNEDGAQDWIAAGQTAIANDDAESAVDARSWSDYGVRDNGALAIAANPDDEIPGVDQFWMDPNEVYEGVLNGTWAPYSVVSGKGIFPKYDDDEIDEVGDDYDLITNLRTLPSVRIVFTSNKEFWTRVPVVEIAEYNTDERRLKMIRTANSKDINGVEQSSQGWSWFPGYAIDKNAGVRLNMMFGENSSLIDENGDDMLWNPTSTIGEYDYSFSNGIVHAEGQIFGGMHYVYVLNTPYQGSKETDNPHYDQVVDLIGADGPADRNDKKKFYTNVAWAGIPILAEDATLLSTDVSIDINVAQPLKEWGAGEFECAEDITNNGFPKYAFTTSNINVTNIEDRYNTDDPVNLVGVVPNPYYGSSYYETGQLDHIVKITNVPPRAVISIYNVSGTLINQLKGADFTGDVIWGLKNNKGISIASGVYIIHVKTPTGEKTIKWFGALRPIDLDSF